MGTARCGLVGTERALLEPSDSPRHRRVVTAVLGLRLLSLHRRRRSGPDGWSTGPIRDGGCGGGWRRHPLRRWRRTLLPGGCGLASEPRDADRGLFGRRQRGTCGYVG